MQQFQNPNIRKLDLVSWFCGPSELLLLPVLILVFCLTPDCLLPSLGAVRVEELVSALKLDPIQELSEEEKGKAAQNCRADRLHAAA